MRFSGFLTALIGLPVLLSGSISSALAQDNMIGKGIYDEACSVCHGSSGLGDGEFAQHLNVKPTDLTKIASNEGDKKFPYLKVFMIVDGRTGVRGHGSADMPIWGSVFEREVGQGGGPYGHELFVRARLVALVDYIESIQTK